MKFYEVKQSKKSVGFFRKRKLAEKYVKLFNTKTIVHSLEITEHRFLTEKDMEE